MSVDRSDLHALLDRVPESDLPVTRKLLQALAADWDVAAEAFFDSGREGIPHKNVLKEFDLASGIRGSSPSR